jgi:hypothetical protein
MQSHDGLTITASQTFLYLKKNNFFVLLKKISFYYREHFLKVLVAFT